MIEGRVPVYGLVADRPPRAFIRRGSCLKEFRVPPGTQRCSPPALSVAATVSRLVEGANVHGVTELFPVSSLGHSVQLPALARQWVKDLNVSAPESPYLAFIVGLHVATAAALLVFFWRDWLRILAGFATSLRVRRIQTRAERLAWLIVLATIPVGLSRLALEHLFRTTLGKLIPAAVFLIVNGGILLGGERLRRRSAAPRECGRRGHGYTRDPRIGQYGHCRRRSAGPDVIGPGGSHRLRPDSRLAARRFRRDFCDAWRCWRTRCEMGIINYQGPAA